MSFSRSKIFETVKLLFMVEMCQFQYDTSYKTILNVDVKFTSTAVYLS
jgi:hypothetical protein